MAAPAIARLRDHETHLKILNLHTGESLSAVIWADGAPVPEELARVNRVMRDHRTGETIYTVINLGIAHRLAAKG